MQHNQTPREFLMGKRQNENPKEKKRSQIKVTEGKKKLDNVLIFLAPSKYKL